MCIKDIPCNCHTLIYFLLKKKRLLLSITYDIVCVFGGGGGQFFYLDFFKRYFDISANIIPIFLSGLPKKTSAPISTPTSKLASMYTSIGRHNDWTLVVKSVREALVGLVIVILTNQGSILHIGRSRESKALITHSLPVLL